jgi:hypothetical protein
MHRVLHFGTLSTVLCLTASCSSSPVGESAARNGAEGKGTGSVAEKITPAVGSKFDNVVVILMENHSYSEVYGTGAFMTQLADQNANLTNYQYVDHPSEPNYLAIAAGQTFNPPSGDDLYHVFDTPNIVDSLESAGLTWKAFSESASGPCDTGNPDIRHIPFLFFADVVNNPDRCGRVLPTTPNTDDELIAELNSTTAANFVWLTPNDSNNMHDTDVPTGDAYLANLVPQILGSTTFTSNRAALFIVFDEGSGSPGSDPIYAVWAAPVVKQAQVFGTSYVHYSILATLEANWGLAPIRSNDQQATPMMEVFQ